jgi:hypothetical protein
MPIVFAAVFTLCQINNWTATLIISLIHNGTATLIISLIHNQKPFLVCRLKVRRHFIQTILRLVSSGNVGKNLLQRFILWDSSEGITDV